MTFDDLLSAATQLAKTEGLASAGTLRYDSIARYLDRLGHVLNLVMAIELKEAELVKLRELKTEATAELEERNRNSIVGLTEQLRRYLLEEPWKR